MRRRNNSRFVSRIHQRAKYVSAPDNRSCQSVLALTVIVERNCGRTAVVRQVNMVVVAIRYALETINSGSGWRSADGSIPENKFINGSSRSA